MSSLKSFSADARGSSLQIFGLTAGIVALACMAGANLLDMAVNNGTLSQSALLDAVTDARYAKSTASIVSPRDGVTRESTRQVTVDYTPTASIPANLAQPIILDPCTGARK